MWHIPVQELIKFVSKFVHVRSNEADDANIFRTIDNLILSLSFIFSCKIKFVKLSSNTWPGVEFNCKRLLINERQWLGNLSKYVEIRIQSSSDTLDGSLTTVRIPK